MTWFLIHITLTATQLGAVPYAEIRSEHATMAECFEERERQKPRADQAERWVCVDNRNRSFIKTGGLDVWALK